MVSQDHSGNGGRNYALDTFAEYSDDAARANWGGKWRMPMYREIDELRNYCTFTWTTQNGVNGCKVSGRNGRSFFLPAAGKILCYGETASSVTTGLRSYFPMNQLTLGTSASIRGGISSECTLSETLGLLFGQFSIINGICGQHAFDA